MPQVNYDFLSLSSLKRVLGWDPNLSMLLLSGKQPSLDLVLFSHLELAPHFKQMKATRPKTYRHHIGPSLSLRNLSTLFLVMRYNMSWDFIWILVFFTLCCSSSLVHSLDNTASESLNSLVQDFAFRSFVKRRPQTGALYDALLPQNLSGMDVSVVRLRSRRLWNKGANFSYFRIPPRTASIPHVRRLAIVYHNLGNWSSQYYSLPGYSLISSVVGFMVFDASNVTDTSARNLTLNTMGQPICIQFPNVTFMGGIKSSARCVAFNANGTFQLTEMSCHGVCYSRDQGHFSVVIPLEKKRRKWYLWVIGCVVGFFGLIIVGYAGFSSMRLLNTKRVQAMERQANEDLVLESRWVGNSKMPSAAVTRTQPILESGVA